MTALSLLFPVSGGAVLTALYASSLPSTQQYWLRTTIALAVASALANAVFAFHLGNALYRDAIAAAMVAASCTAVIGWIGGAFRDRPIILRLGSAVLALVIFAVSAPFIELIAHCTSGDCI
jgi:hypothetical protein